MANEPDIERVPNMDGATIAKYLRQVAKAFGHVPEGPEMVLTVGRDTYVITGGEAVWMKVGSDSVFYLTLEEYSRQLTFIDQNGTFVIQRKAIGSTRRTSRRGTISLQHDGYNYSPNRSR